MELAVPLVHADDLDRDLLGDLHALPLPTDFRRLASLSQAL